jgi:hypothetical protein
MKLLLAILGWNFLPIICVVAAIILAYNGLSGWGWFLFVGLLTFVAPKSEEEDKDSIHMTYQPDHERNLT